MEIKICSSNIRYENEHDGIHHWKNRLPILSIFLNLQHLDFLGTQEGRENQIRSLAKNLNLKISDQHRTWIDVRMYPTLFFNENNFELMEANDYWLSETPNIAGSSSFKSAFPRLATWMKIKSKINGEKYFITNVHLDHVLSETRVSQSNVIIQMSRQINSDNLPMILLGDFNDHPMSEVYQMLKTELNLIDYWHEQKLPEETSHHGFNGAEQSGHRIDWILVSPHFNCLKIELMKHHENGIYLSDHFPLLATLIPN